MSCRIHLLRGQQGHEFAHILGIVAHKVRVWQTSVQLPNLVAVQLKGAGSCWRSHITLSDRAPGTSKDAKTLAERRVAVCKPTRHVRLFLGHPGQCLLGRPGGAEVCTQTPLVGLQPLRTRLRSGKRRSSDFTLMVRNRKRFSAELKRSVLHGRGNRQRVAGCCVQPTLPCKAGRDKGKRPTQIIGM